MSCGWDQIVNTCGYSLGSDERKKVGFDWSDSYGHWRRTALAARVLGGTVTQLDILLGSCASSYSCPIKPLESRLQVC